MSAAVSPAPQRPLRAAGQIGEWTALALQTGKTLEERRPRGGHKTIAYPGHVDELVACIIADQNRIKILVALACIRQSPVPALELA